MKIITNNILARLYAFLAECDSFIFLHTSKPDKVNWKSLLFTRPIERLRFHEGDDESFFFDRIERFQRKGKYLAGWFSYEFGYLLEPGLRGLLNRPEDSGSLLADLGVFSSCNFFDHRTGQTDFPLADNNDTCLTGYLVKNLRVSQRKERYLQALAKILEYIEAGDTYQVNYTLKLLFDFNGSAERLYDDLRRNQSVGYGAYLRWQDQRILSFSPELFFRKDSTSVMVRPMKGTLKRGRNLEEDAVNRSFLQNDMKNQSENVMIVDLLRNDLGRLMHYVSEGDVQVDSLFDVETYETLLQMTSTITGRTSRDELAKVSLHDFFKAIFPCGSVTGAPKIRTMEIIDELEKGRRGVYTGAIGYVLPEGEAMFNVPIRTVVLDGPNGEMGIGSGIVHDSDPQEEWRECLLKGHFLTSPQKRFQLIETLLWQRSHGFFLEDEHLERLRRSAQFFLFTCNIDDLASELRGHARKISGETARVRLLLTKDGSCSIESQPCEVPLQFNLPVTPDFCRQKGPYIVLSNERVDSTSSWYYHKTTNRELYDREYKGAQKRGAIDKIFENEKGNVTEGCITNLIIYKDGAYLTPPVDDGLLGGVMRNHLLGKGCASLHEQSLTAADLHEADALFLCNSVRGVVQVFLRQG